MNTSAKFVMSSMEALRLKSRSASSIGSPYSKRAQMMDSSVIKSFSASGSSIRKSEIASRKPFSTDRPADSEEESE